MLQDTSRIARHLRLIAERERARPGSSTWISSTIERESGLSALDARAVPRPEDLLDTVDVDLNAPDE